MPIDVIDYSNTVFYKIYCKDAAIKDLYVGHTTNFVQRKYAHKRTCIKEKDANHHLKVYKFIRDNGGWDNWRMDIIAFRDCYDHYEARKVEQHYFETLQATLNSIEPLPKPKPRPTSTPKEKRVWYCNVCKTTCETNKALITHEETKKHKRNSVVNTPHNNDGTNTKISKGIKTFECDICIFKCSNKFNYDKHILTAKHKNRTLQTKKMPENATAYDCFCGKLYKSRSSLWYHKKKCVQTNSLTIIEEKEREPTDNSIILGLISQNKELMEMLQEQNKILQDIVPKIINNNAQ